MPDGAEPRFGVGDRVVIGGVVCAVFVDGTKVEYMVQMEGWVGGRPMWFRQEQVEPADAGLVPSTVANAVE